jgi:hypothetical protein
MTLPDDYEHTECEAVELRDGEARDLSAHARRNLKQIRMAEQEGTLDADDAAQARQRILDEQEGGE